MTAGLFLRAARRLPNERGRGRDARKRITAESSDLLGAGMVDAGLLAGMKERLTVSVERVKT